MANLPRGVVKVTIPQCRNCPDLGSQSFAEREVQEEEERRNYTNRQKVRVIRKKLKLMKEERRLTCWVAG